ncbi:MAG: hypothetical protein LBH42_02875 [Treponema sp.]|jgi:hypothetical protein|nr:hypothetical protein [Treponema sp.]
MDAEKKPVILPWSFNSGDPGFDHDLKNTSFEDVLNSACERLKGKHIQYSIRRLREMNEELDKLENELDQLLSGRSKE